MAVDDATDQRTRSGWPAHRDGVDRLRASYAALAPAAPVRLAKATSNLFRVRDRTTAPGLDVTGLRGVIEVDAGARTAQVQGMCTYEDLVAATLAHGLVPSVVPQLRTITLGGAVAGLGVESTSFRHGLPHESVRELEVLTGDGRLVTTRPGDALFDAFPGSYGSLGYATRLELSLEEVPSYVALRHVRFHDAASLARAVAGVVATGRHDDERVDGMDGVCFAPDELYLVLARRTGRKPVDGVPLSDYTGRWVYYRSIRRRTTDLLTVEDYLWRWDTDWFWCSRALGVQHPVVRRLWPRRWRRSDVYHRLVGLDQRHGLVDRLDRRSGRPRRERVVQDVEVPLERLADFLAWFERRVGMRPVWLCPVVARREWPTFSLVPGETYVNVGFWGTVPVGPDAPDAPTNRAVEAYLDRIGGHKSLYSEAFYDRPTFDALYGGATLAAVSATTDPEGRLTTLYDKAVGGR